MPDEITRLREALAEFIAEHEPKEATWVYLGEFGWQALPAMGPASIWPQPLRRARN